MLFEVLMITFVAGVLGTGAGGALGVLFCRESEKITGLLVSFAAGIMLSVVCFNMIGDAMLPESAGRQMDILLVDAGIAAGFFMVWGLNGWIQAVRRDFFSRLLSAGIVMIAAIAIHNLPEGMVIGASYVADAVRTTGTGAAGFLLAVVIGIHNIPEGMAVAVTLVNGGVSRIKTVLLAAASGVPTVIGACIGWRLGTMGPVMLCLMLSFAAGAMLYVVMGELIPEALEIWHSKMVAISILAGMLTGMVIIYA